jgi:hypothetical protein
VSDEFAKRRNHGDKNDDRRKASHTALNQLRRPRKQTRPMQDAAVCTLISVAAHMMINNTRAATVRAIL